MESTATTTTGETLKTWERTFYQPSGSHAHIHMVVFGEIKQPLDVSQSKYRIAGVPNGIDVNVIDRDTDEEERIPLYFKTYTDEALNHEDPPLYHAVRLAQTAVEVRGMVRDPSTLDYLRDIIGIVACVAESGGQAVLDINSRKWFRPERWRALVFNAGELVPGQHVAAFVTTQGRGPLSWVRTRGMVTFGRPDLSIRDVPPSAVDQVLELCGRFTKLFAMGAVPVDGQEVKMSAFPHPLRCRLLPPTGEHDFTNGRIEIKFPLSTGNTGPLTRRTTA